MLKWYNASHVYQGVISKYKDLKIESDLKTADKTLSVTLLEESGITNECYVRTATDEYVVKEVSTSTGALKSIVCALNLEDLEAKAYKSFSVTGQTIANAARTALTGTGWTVDTSDVTKQRNAGMLKKNALQVLQDLCTAFMCEMSFDTINKKVSFYESMGSDRGVYFRSGLNLKKLTAKTSSYDFYTRIIPYGADDLDIKSVNGGAEYLSNTQYSSKVRTYIWIDTNYTDATALKEDAAAKLADMSKPTVSYSAEIRDLAKMSSTYSLFEYGLGDTVTLTDADTKVRDKQRIVKLTEYPDTPEKNTCQLSNTFLTWEEMQAKQREAAAIVDAVISQDGTYNGSVKVSDILHWNDAIEEGVTNSTYLNNYIQTTDGRIEAVELDVGTIQANYITADQVAATYATISTLESDYATITNLNAVSADVQGINARVASIETAYISTAQVNTLLAGYANITLANIDTSNIAKAVIKDLFTEVGLITSATIVDGKITGYLDAVNVNAANITAGTLVADRIAIRGSNTSLVYALNNYGQITSTETNTLDGYVLTPRTINADKIIAGTITANEIAASTITANKMNVTSLSSVCANIGTVTAGILSSADWEFTSGIYADAGMRISLNDKYIRTPNFAVVNGNLYAQNADIAGKITATSGSISGSLVTSGISATNITTGTLTAIAINNGNGTFSVSSAGVLSATGATISGAITATSGNIGGFSIENNYQIVYRDQMTAGTAGTQYATFMRAQESASTPATGSTAAFGVVHRSYDGSSYGSWTNDFIVRHDGSVYCYGGALHIEDTSSSSHNGKIQFANAWIGSSASRSLALHATGDLEVYASDDLYITGDLVSITTGIDGTTGNPVGSVALETSNLGIIGNTTLRGTLQTSQNINIVSTASSAYAVGVQNAAKKVQLYMASTGQMGVYNATDSHYVICEDTDNVIRMPQVYAKTNSGAANIYIDQYGRTYRSTSSSKRYKKEIKPLEDWKSILDIPVVSFMYRKGYLSEDDQRYGVSVPGLIAEDVAEHYAVAAEVSGGKVEDWNIRYIVPPMLAVEQDHERRIKELEEELARLKGGVA